MGSTFAYLYLQFSSLDCTPSSISATPQSYSYHNLPIDRNYKFICICSLRKYPQLMKISNRQNDTRNVRGFCGNLKSNPKSELPSHRIKLYYSNQCIKIRAISFATMLLMMIGLNTERSLFVCFYLFDDLHPNFSFHRKCTVHRTRAVTTKMQSNRIYDTLYCRQYYRQLTCFTIVINSRIYKFR